MREAFAVARGNVGLLAGVVAGTYLAGTAVAYAGGLVGKVGGATVGKYAGLVSALAVSGLSFMAAYKFSRSEIFVGFGSVAFAIAVQQGVSLFMPAQATE
jgi:hypothetical protein